MPQTTTLNGTLISSWIGYINSKNLAGCETLLDDSVELHSTMIMNLFPGSGGIIMGKESALKYFDMVFTKFPEIVLHNTDIKIQAETVVVKSCNNQGKNFYVQYFISPENKIRKIKADVTED